MIRLLLAILKQLVKPLNRIAAALERIARIQEHTLLSHRGASAGFMSFEAGDNAADGAIFTPTDEDFAEMELLEKKLGDIELDRDLERQGEG